MTGHDLITRARQEVALKTKWRHQGREPGQALDCVGLLYCVAWAHGLEAEDIRNYSKRPGSQALYETLDRYCTNLGTEAPRQPGDILVLSVAGEDPQHTALWTGAGTVIHASAAHRKVVEQRFDDDLRRGLCRVYRLKGLDG